MAQTVNTEDLMKVTVEEKESDQAVMQPAGPDDFDWYGDGGGDHTCEWSETMCDRTATHYTHRMCGDENCEADHTQYYCERHYALTLALTLDHLKQCEGYKHEEPCEANRVVTLVHIDGFGQLRQ